MDLSRRSFLSMAAAAGIAPASLASARRGADDSHVAEPAATDPPRQAVGPDRFDPWVEVDADALAHNVARVTELSGGRPILAVVKNNAYGLDLLTAARLLEPMDAIAGFAVVKAEAAFVLRERNIAKPVLHMGMATSTDGTDLARIGVQPSLYTDDAVQRVNAMSRAVGDLLMHLSPALPRVVV